MFHHNISKYLLLKAFMVPMICHPLKICITHSKGINVIIMQG